MQRADFNWFLNNYDNLYKKYGHKFLVIKDETVLGAYESYDRLISMIDDVANRFAVNENTESCSEEDQIEQAIIYIRNKLDKKVTRTMVADFVHLNEDYLSRLFKKKTGMVLKDYINNEKIRVAKEMLSNSNISVSIIAIKTGFNNFSHFSQTFKKMTGVSPREFRESHILNK